MQHGPDVQIVIQKHDVKASPVPPIDGYLGAEH
jgi:hypothetical protein